MSRLDAALHEEMWAPASSAPTPAPAPTPVGGPLLPLTIEGKIAWPWAEEEVGATAGEKSDSDSAPPSSSDKDELMKRLGAAMLEEGIVQPFFHISSSDRGGGKVGAWRGAPKGAWAGVGTVVEVGAAGESAAMGSYELPKKPTTRMLSGAGDANSRRGFKEFAANMREQDARYKRSQYTKPGIPDPPRNIARPLQALQPAVEQADATEVADFLTHKM
ncbi:hypothetical protein B484DRAFT_451141 [Ochromonadaceae sp. CCMP2298]|nr:hypothetical protein B484DRAFT_451141 [Ochromonadaceae sp. CCMP2298]